jgi:hypothetical protein
MPLLNDADEVYKGSVRVDRVYKGDTLVWPKVETWSAWYEVTNSSAGPHPSAWFAAGIADHYDAGGHERVRFRYSNLGRVHWRGIMKNINAGALASGQAVIGCEITDPNVPAPNQDTRMTSGPSGTAYAPALWGGGFARYDAQPYASGHHLLVVANVDAVAIASGVWFAIDGIFAFSGDS